MLRSSQMLFSLNPELITFRPGLRVDNSDRIRLRHCPTRAQELILWELAEIEVAK
ncbi:hypothetical protein XYCOK13_37210 [Xylanibacillus composti]|uniref:Uncharacterized protein n=1 Tax=Xylanibacillus composti TaxID=1572762 RepID=A0A8J4M484_9BACL|nr:hypothetical protein XYCOK13_37210 [Xylanibacillus composti]